MRVAGLTPEEMAEALDVSRNTIGNYRSGRTKPSKLQVKEWAIRTGAPLEWLVSGRMPDDEAPRPEEDEGQSVHPPGLEPGTHWLRAMGVVTPIRRIGRLEPIPAAA